MSEIRLKAKSSSGNPYDLIFMDHGDFFTIFCNCQAGTFGKLCKHKTWALSGDDQVLENQEDRPLLREIHAKALGSSYSALLSRYVDVQAEVKREIAEIRKKEYEFRDIMETAMRKGIPYNEK
jgi:hypothetical protein